MKSMFRRRGMAVGVAAVAALAAFVAPSAANAEALPGHCKGTATLRGDGSTFQELAEHLWAPAFAEKKYEKKGGCENVAVTYNPEKPEGSGAGEARWQTKEEYGLDGFIGTDNTANATEKLAIENEVNTGLEKPKGVNGKGEPEGGASHLLTIPVMMGAEAMVIHLPEHCKASSTAASGRLALNQAMINKIYSVGATWKEVAEQEGAGNEIVTDGTGTCETSAPVKAVVRFDGSGTTHIFKVALAKNSSAKFEDESGGSHSWLELAEGTPAIKCDGAKDTKLNECWPTAAKVIHATTSGNPGVLKEVAATAGSIGYADLAQARTEGGFAPGDAESSAAKFWAVVESSAKVSSKGTKRKYEDPSKNKYSATPSSSNCKDTEFVNGSETFPPPSVLSPWNEVGAKRESKTYPICGLTYVLVNTNYAAYSEHGGNTPEAQSVKDYVGFITNKATGGKVIKNHDYLESPKSLAAKVEEGLALIEG